MEVIRRSKLKNNTYEYVYADGSRAIELHGTQVFYQAASGEITLDTGGWYSKVTRDRINDQLEATKFTLLQRKDRWLLDNDRGKTLVYYDGITLLT